MARWIVFVGPYEQMRVDADDEEEAIQTACDDAGFDSPGAMAAEYEGFTARDVRAVRIRG